MTQLRIIMIAVGFMLLAQPTLAQQCIGDCNDDGRVTIDELILGVNLALNGDPDDTCPSITCVLGHGIFLPCLIVAVDNALHGCVTKN